MTTSSNLTDRVRQIISDAPGLDERRMFGGDAFLINGNLAVGSRPGRLLVRVGPDDCDAALAQPGVRIMENAKQQMWGWVWVDETVLDDDADLTRWVNQGIAFASALPSK